MSELKKTKSRFERRVEQKRLQRRDMLILSALRQNARMPLTTISKRTSVPVTTIHGLLREYEQHVIKKHATILDFKKLGYDNKQSIIIKAAGHDKDKIKRYLLENKSVNSVYLLDGPGNFLIEAITKTKQEVDSLMHDLQEQFTIFDLLSFEVVDDLKREEVFSDIMLREFHD
jgi:DNA-binding Lrp family transcriptional regulator